MAKKKLNNLSDLGGFVFSTNQDEDFSEYAEDVVENVAPKDQHLEAHFSNKGRGGKTVTLITGFRGSETELKTLAKLLKTKCSVGGSVKEGEINIVITLPNGEELKDLTIDTSADIQFSQSVKISEEEDKYYGQWEYSVESNKASGHYRLSIQTR